MSAHRWKVGDEVFAVKREWTGEYSVDRSRIKSIDKNGTLTLMDRRSAWGFGVRLGPGEVFPSEREAWAGLAEKFQTEAADLAKRAGEADARATECRDRALALALRAESSR